MQIVDDAILCVRSWHYDAGKISGGLFCLNTMYKNLQFKLLHFFTLIGTDNNCFLGATLRYVSVQYTRTIVNLDSIVLQGMCVELILTYFYLFRAVLKLGHWKVNPEIDSNRFRLIY